MFRARRGRHRLRRAADVQRLRRRRQQAAGPVGAAGRCWRASASWRRASRSASEPDRRAAGRRHRTSCRAPVGSINSLTTQIADLNRQHRRRQGHRPRAQRPARPARPADRRAVEARPGDDDRGRRRHASASSSAAARSWCSAATRRRWSAVRRRLRSGARCSSASAKAASTRAFPDGFIAGGSIAGLLRFQNHDLADARNLLGQLAAAIAGSLNAQQALGLDLGQPARLRRAAARDRRASVAPSSNNAMAGGVPVASYVNGSGVRVSSVSDQHRRPASCSRATTSCVADPSLPAGSYRLTRLSDGTTQTVAERRRRRRLSHRHRRAAAGGARPLPAAAGLDRGARHARACSTIRRASPRRRR